MHLNNKENTTAGSDSGEYEKQNPPLGSLHIDLHFIYPPMYSAELWIPVILPPPVLYLLDLMVRELSKVPHPFEQILLDQFIFFILTWQYILGYLQ